MKIYFGADHGGFKLKNYLIAELEKLRYETKDCGAFTYDANDDYPDMIKETIESVAADKNCKGILCCRSGVGMSIMANRNPKIRAALCFNQEMAEKARQHNDANMLCLGGDYITKKQALEMAKIFLTTKFAGGRHKTRLEKIEKYAK